MLLFIHEMFCFFCFLTFPALIRETGFYCAVFSPFYLCSTTRRYKCKYSCQFYKDLIQSAQDLDTKQEHPGDNSVLQWSDQRPDLNPTLNEDVNAIFQGFFSESVQLFLHKGHQRCKFQHCKTFKCHHLPAKTR